MKRKVKCMVQGKIYLCAVGDSNQSVALYSMASAVCSATTGTKLRL